METLEFIANRYKADLAKSIIGINQSRWHDLGHMLNDLGFKKGVEVGVNKAAFTQVIAKRAPNMEIVGVDIWTNKSAYVEAKRRASRFPNIRLVKGKSVEVSKQFDDESLDWVFIDADHEYSSVVEDIAAWSKKVRKGGIVSGHDYYVINHFKENVPFFGVKQAVDGWIETHFIKHLFVGADGYPCWMYVVGDTKY